MTSSEGTTAPPSKLKKPTRASTTTRGARDSEEPRVALDTSRMLTVQPRAEPRELVQRGGGGGAIRTAREATHPINSGRASRVKVVSPLHLAELLLHGVGRLVDGEDDHVTAARAALNLHLWGGWGGGHSLLICIVSENK